MIIYINFRFPTLSNWKFDFFFFFSSFILVLKNSFASSSYLPIYYIWKNYITFMHLIIFCVFELRKNIIVTWYLFQIILEISYTLNDTFKKLANYIRLFNLGSPIYLNKINWKKYWKIISSKSSIFISFL